MRPFLYIALCVSCLTSAPSGAQERLDDSELAAQTGGLRTPTGIEFNFGATVDTYVDGQMALQTRLTWTEQGIVQTQTPHSGDLSAGGVTLPGLNGETVIIHDIADQRIASLVLNSADGRDIRQDTAITLTIPELTNLQSEFSGQRTEMQLNSAVGRALTDAVR